MAKRTNAPKARLKTRETLQILGELGFPRQQVNERSALTLLALLDLKPQDSWADARDPLIGITPMMEFFGEYYGKRYAPNTRETVRRQSAHQFVQAALVVLNPDEPSRPTNSPKAVYRIEPSALALLRKFGTPEWNAKLHEYLDASIALKTLCAKERQMRRIPVVLHSGDALQLSPGGHSTLVKRILDDFCSLFTPGARVLYVGDTEKKWAYFDADALRDLGIEVQEHGKMPDVVVHYQERNWLVLVEAVTSHGPVNPKRREELRLLFAASKAGIVYVTAFASRRAMIKYLDEISWETEVWIAESPTHLVHFNGERFLGPYE
jgi:hypothetical protein